MDPKDLLIADLEHFGESMWRNEEVGEKRFDFFVTLTTAVVAGLVALAASDKEIPGLDLRTVAGAALGALMVIGLLSYARMLHRNLVTDEYQRTLSYIRERYKAACPEIADYRVPRLHRRWSVRWLRAGYAETLAAVVGMLLAAFLVVALRWSPIGSIGAGSVVAVGLWVLASVRKKGGRGQPGPARYFRAGVGAVIKNGAGDVLTLERADLPGAWQLPQGGLEEGEEPDAAVLREVEEETGLRATDLELKARAPEPLVYELPPAARNPKVGLGQVQYWYLFELRRAEAGIALKRGGEFRASSWQPFAVVLENAVAFRRPVYERLRAEFALR